MYSTSTVEPHGGEPIEQAGEPLDQSPVMIMVHGRGAGPENILELVPRLRDGWTYLAPGASRGAWYPFSFMAPPAQNEPGLSSGLDVLGCLVTSVMKRGIPPWRIVFLGFSQGACLAAEFLARNPRRYGGGLIFSGGLIGSPGPLRNYPGSLKGTPIFLGCSDEDTHIPRSRVEESAAAFKKLNADTTCTLYPGMGHVICDDEIEAATRIMTLVEGPAPQTS